MSIITSKNTFNRIKIYIDNIIYISIPKDSNTKIHAWYEDDNLYKLEIYCVGHTDIYEFNKYETWKEVLTHLDNLI